jgi:drug/metabolite transporter (DMT)-like permease
MTQCLAAPIGALLEWAWRGQVPTGVQIVAGCTILSGVFLALAPQRGSAWTGVEWKSGVWFGLLAALGQSGGAVLSRQGFELARLAGEQAHPMTVSLQRALAGLVVGGLWYGAARLRSGPVPLGPALLAGRGWLLANALAGPTLGVVCYQWALARHPVSQVLPVVAMVPLAVIPLAYWLEQERPTRRSLIGGVLAVAGVVGLARYS